MYSIHCDEGLLVRGRVRILYNNPGRLVTGPQTKGLLNGRGLWVRVMLDCGDGTEPMHRQLPLCGHRPPPGSRRTCLRAAPAHATRN